MTQRIPINPSFATQHAISEKIDTRLLGKHPTFSALPPLALYIHIPWCIKKCPYCDFNSHRQSDQGVPEDRYLSALEADLESLLPLVWGRPISSIFIGGGTPSLFSPEGIDRLLASVRARLKLLPDAEITMEANPGTFEYEKFKAFRAAGINRLSIGIQSFQPRFLSALGRVHNGDEARRAVEIGISAFDRVNLDVMYALPEQSLSDAQLDVQTALEFKVSHLSFYHLTLEPNTYFHRYPPPVPDEDSAADMQDMIESQLAEHGYEHYEVSAFAQPNQYSRHNRNYWEFGDYLGIGAGAHGKISFPNKVIRQQRYKQPEQYMQQALLGSAVQESHEISKEAMGFEFMMNALRLSSGVPSELFEQRTGHPLSIINSPLHTAIKNGWLTENPRYLQATPLGQRFLNDLLELFLI